MCLGIKCLRSQIPNKAIYKHEFILILEHPCKVNILVFGKNTNTQLHQETCQLGRDGSNI